MNVHVYITSISSGLHRFTIKKNAFFKASVLVCKVLPQTNHKTTPWIWVRRLTKQTNCSLCWTCILHFLHWKTLLKKKYEWSITYSITGCHNMYFSSIYCSRLHQLGSFFLFINWAAAVKSQGVLIHCLPQCLPLLMLEFSLTSAMCLPSALWCTYMDKHFFTSNSFLNSKRI